MTLTTTLATRLGMGDGGDLIETLKMTAFKGQVSDAQMTALMVVANQYGLNPWTKEIYAFPDKNNGIVPVVGVDGWARIINEHVQFDGMEFEQDDEKCTCIMYRKDRSRPTKITEYMSECKRGNAQPWISHPKRMLRHKAMIQCARVTFGYGGIYDQDEAERFMGPADVVGAPPPPPAAPPPPAELPPYAQAELDANVPAWRKAFADGKATPDALIARISTKAVLSEIQKTQIRNLVPIENGATTTTPTPTAATQADPDTGELPWKD